MKRHTISNDEVDRTVDFYTLAKITGNRYENIRSWRWRWRWRWRRRGEGEGEGRGGGNRIGKVPNPQSEVTSNGHLPSRNVEEEEEEIKTI